MEDKIEKMSDNKYRGQK